ncbi:hypothetical protein AA0N74_07940 [Chromobacterium vaccinii]|uniref:hypothetical protein n=1 Tax=Chromobacterium vaccinii TaxID=1108595 RepID=UPI0031D23058
MSEATICAELDDKPAGLSAKEIGKAIGEATPVLMEQLLLMVAAGTLKQRTVGRDQVFSLAKRQRRPAPKPAAVQEETAEVAPEVAPLPSASPRTPISGTLTLNLADDVVTTGFQTVDQLQRFATALKEVTA